MHFSNDIFLREFPKFGTDNIASGLACHVLTEFGVKSKANYIKKVPPEVELQIVKTMGERFVDKPYYILGSSEIVLPQGRRQHYFILNDQGKILDILSWAYPFADYKDGLEVLEAELPAVTERENPYNDQELSRLPVILWATVRAIFKGDNHIGGFYKRDIERIYERYSHEKGYSRRAALNRTFAIATGTLQKRGYLIRDTNLPTDKGQRRSNELIAEWGQDELRRRFKEYEEILRQGKL